MPSWGAFMQMGEHTEKFLGIIGIILLVDSIKYSSNHKNDKKGGNMNMHEKIKYVEFPAKNLRRLRHSLLRRSDGHL